MFDLELRNLERKLPVKVWQELLERVSNEFIAFDLKAVPHNLVICRKCRDFREVPIAAAYVPVGVMVKGANNMMRTKVLQTNKALVKWFTEAHLEKCAQSTIKELATEYLMLH